ncbi:MAG TPA: adenosylhomocysteinase [Fibrobacter sp.]|nr:adenosylhomocysteinase [Fibrobacter sp.]
MFEEYIESIYKPVEYPALWEQRKAWIKTKPLKGYRLLDASPVFRNSLVKYDALLAAGASLSIGFSKKIPNDPFILKIIIERGLSIYSTEEAAVSWDIVLDCAAQFAHVDSKYGFVELTRSGVSVYEKSNKPVYVADSSEIKKIETSLGTGESYFRAMKEFGFSDWKEKELLVFGSGKVGSGIITHALRLGAKITVVTDSLLYEQELYALGVSSVVDFKELSAVAKKIVLADFIVTATGIKNALNHPEWVRALLKTNAVLGNMGVEDEYGDPIPEKRVLYAKEPLNFSLQEPTQLKFIDATLALHNALGLALLKTSGSGIRSIPVEIEQHILEITRQNGEIL